MRRVRRTRSSGRRRRSGACCRRSMMRVLTGGTLIDGTGATPVADAAVVIEGDRIIATGPRASTAWPADAEVLDVRGRTVIPGLIDAHDHMASHGYALATRWGLDEPASTAHLRTARVLADTLAMGYTTVRDAGGLAGGPRTARRGLLAGRAAGARDGIARAGTARDVPRPRRAGASDRARGRRRLDRARVLSG